MGFFRDTPRSVTSYREVRQGTSIFRARGNDSHDKIATFGGDEYAIQVQHPDGRWLKIKWDGTIEAPMSDFGW